MNFSYVCQGISILLILIAAFSTFSWALRTLLAVAGIGLLASSLVVGPVFLGNNPWYDSSPWKELIAFSLMVLGMASRTLSLAIEKRRAQLAAGKTPGPMMIDKWEAVYPFLVSFITFGGIQSQVSDQHLGVPMLVFAFQNGFFWQTLIGQVEAKVSAR